MNHPAVSIISIGFGLVGMLAAAIMAAIVHQRQAMPTAPHTHQAPEPRRRTPPTRNPRPPINNSNCSICRDPIGPNQEQQRIHCGHRFHTFCIRGWLENSNVCPICRQLVQ